MKSIGLHSVKKAFLAISLGLIASLTNTTSMAQTSSNLLVNPSLENRPNGAFQGWEEAGPISDSAKAYSGSKSAKISGHSGLLKQTVRVTPNTDYILSSYVFGFGRIGVVFNGNEEEKRIHGAEEWTKTEIEFNSGSATSVEVYANYYRQEGRYDNFVLAPENAIARSVSTLLTQCPARGEIPITAAYGNDSEGNNSPKNAIDSNLSNRWSAKGIGKTLTLDLGQTAEVSQLDVMWYKGDQRISLFSVETSIDGSRWKKVLPDASSTQTKGFDSYDIENLIDPDARLVRIIGGGNTSSEWNSIAEVRIKGCVR